MMELPFTTEQFLNVFQVYNNAIWPSQLIAYLFGIVAVICSFWKSPASDKIINSILGFFWLWIGVVYHILFFSEINNAAFGFGTLFIIQGLLFLEIGLFTDKIQYHFNANTFGITGIILIAYAMVIYPIIGSLLGHSYPFSPMFGVTPCPATIFTFGLLLWTNQQIPWWFLLIPGLWSVIGFTAAFQLGIVEDTGLLVSGILSIGLLLYRNMKKNSQKLNPAA
ncbi:DUF6064 family protein [Fodinibius sp. Rm-B-1B1-1]|uniref:DUF6064 family protein n=1 Tax=Fodinibius alkaliphilus TaxID=3140241 RepID=UPI00315A70B2